ncbi:oligosaccharide flippase family protein [bacterium]|nr:oligosaccharide flippase family protein [bacterium]
MEKKREYFFVLVRGVSDILDFIRGFLLIYILGGAFGSEVFGTWGLIEQIYSVAVILTGLGLSQSVIRFLGGSHKSAYVRTLFILSSLLIIALGVILTAVMGFLDPVIAEKVIKTPAALECLRAALPLILLNALELLLDGSFRARLRIDFHSFARMVYTAAILGVYLYASKAGFDLAQIIKLSLLTKGAYVVILYLIFACLEFGRADDSAPAEGDDEFNLPKDGPALPALGGMIVFGAPLMMFGLSTWLFGTGGKVILGFQTGAGEVGRYDASLKIAMLIQYLGLPIAYTLLPVLAEAVSKKGKETVVEICRRFARLYFFLALPLFFGLLATHNDLLDFMTGRGEFRTSLWFFLLPLSGAFLSQLIAFYHNVIFLKGHSRFLFLANFSAALACLFLNTLFTARFGMWCTAVSSVVSYLLLLMMCALKVRSYGFAPLRFLDLGFFLKSFLSALVMFAAVLAARSFLPLEGLLKLASLAAAGALAYFLLVMLRNRFSVKSALKELIG